MYIYITCENLVLSAKVSCHRLSVPLLCLVTRDRLGAGGDARNSFNTSAASPPTPPVEAPAPPLCVDSAPASGIE